MTGSRENEPLPKPSAEAAAHSARVAGLIRSEIERDGPIGFDRYMALALYAPGLGYYSTGLAEFGEAGDFVTAPELSPLFGRCIARQCAEVLDHVGGGNVFELGAGSGALAAQVLTELDALGAPPERYEIFEPSAGLRERQRELLRERAGGLFGRVRWLDQPPGEPWQGVVVANEVVDALPVKRFHYGPEGVLELRVKNQERGFAWTRVPAEAELAERVRALREDSPLPWPSRYQSELLPGLDAWLYSVTHSLTRGMALLVDYGYSRHEYYHPQRADGTLVCHYRHRAHDDPFLFVGLQDITAFVDFTALAEAADRCDLEVAGYTGQGAFLVSTGLTEMLEAPADSERERLDRAARAKRLIMPGDMGDRFKVMALTRGIEPGAPLGFTTLDLREQLLPAGHG